MIFKKIQFQFNEYGRIEDGKIFRLNKINLFVGPNNSGKTLALKEIGSLFKKPKKDFNLFGESIDQKNKKNLSIKKMTLCKNDSVFEQVEEAFEAGFVKFKTMRSWISEFQNLHKSYDRNIKRERNIKNHDYINKFTLDDLEQMLKDKKLRPWALRFNSKRKKKLKVLADKIYKVHLNLSNGISEEDVTNLNALLLYINILFKKYSINRINLKQIWNLKFMDPDGFLENVPTEYIRAVYDLSKDKEEYFRFHSNYPFDMAEEFSDVRNIIQNVLGFKIGLNFHNIKAKNPVSYALCNDDEFRKYELQLTEESWDYFEKQTDLSECSDGIKSVIRLLFKIYSSSGKVFLLDEPDLFLHPPFARKFGSVLTSHSETKNSQFFIATHNLHLLTGLLESGADMNVFRLTYKNKVPRIKKLNNKQLNYIMKDSKIRFSGILESIFADAVILVEGSGDRDAYSRALDYYQKVNSGKKIDGLNFVFAGGKNSIPDLAEGLRKIGIPFVIIMDADALKDNLIEKLFDKLDSDDKKSIKELKDNFIHEVCNQPNVKSIELYLRDNGIRNLSKKSKSKFESLNLILQKNNVFILEEGALEQTVPDIWQRVKEELTNRDKDWKARWQEIFNQTLLEDEKREEILKWPIFSLISTVNEKLYREINQ